MMRSQSLLYKYRIIVAGMKVDYYGWALVLGVGWQGWKQCFGCRLAGMETLFVYRIHYSQGLVYTT